MLINNKQFNQFYAVFILAGFFLLCMGNHDRLSALTNDNEKSHPKDDPKIEITIAYPYDFLFKPALEDKIAPEFMTAHPNIKITFEPPYKTYEEGTSRILEQAGTKNIGGNGKLLTFQAAPKDRLSIIRSIEAAGGVIEEFHTDAPNWDILIHNRFSNYENN